MIEELNCEPLIVQSIEMQVRNLLGDEYPLPNLHLIDFTQSKEKGLNNICICTTINREEFTDENLIIIGKKISSLFKDGIISEYVFAPLIAMDLAPIWKGKVLLKHKDGDYMEINGVKITEEINDKDIQYRVMIMFYGTSVHTFEELKKLYPNCFYREGELPAKLNVFDWKIKEFKI